MLVSYDFIKSPILLKQEIAGSPECWWVTTIKRQRKLKEWIAGSPECWWVTTLINKIYNLLLILQGHQNVGELRLIFGHDWAWLRIAGSPECWWVTTQKFLCCYLILNCRVTRMLVSYDKAIPPKIDITIIAGSPECWWVTTDANWVERNFFRIAGSPECWWVTTVFCVNTIVFIVIAGSPECWLVATK